MPRPTYNGGVDRALNLLLYPSNLASPGRLVKIARSLSPLFSRTHIVGIDQGELPTDEAVAPTVHLTRIQGASLGAPLGGVRVVGAWGARVYRRFARQRVAAVSAQNLFLLPLAHAWRGARARCSPTTRTSWRRRRWGRRGYVSASSA